MNDATRFRSPWVFLFLFFSFQMIVKYDLVAAYLKREKEHQGDQLVIKIKLRQQKILSMRTLAAFQ